MHPNKPLQWHIQKSLDDRQAAKQACTERGELRVPSVLDSFKCLLLKAVGAQCSRMQ